MDNPTQTTSVQAVANSITKPVLRTALPKAKTALSAADLTILETSAEETLVAEVEVIRATNPTEAVEITVEVPEEDSVEITVEATVEDSVEATVEEEETVVEEVKPTRTRK